MFFYSQNEAVAPLTVEADVASKSFGSVNMGSSTTQSISITATGTGTESYSTGISGNDSADFSVTVNSTGNVTGGGSAVTLTVRFMPTSGAPSPGLSKSATLTITLSGGGTDTVSLSGTSVIASNPPPGGGGGGPGGPGGGMGGFGP